MPKKIFLFTYHKYSKSARSLAMALGAKMIKHENSAFRPTPDKMVINWGSNKEGIRGIAKGDCDCINTPWSVALCANKLRFFEALSEVASVPEYTESIQQANMWIDEGSVVVGRTSLNGKGGEGIIMSDDEEKVGFNRCSMFTKYIPKLKEFRVHVVDGKVADVQQKVLRQEDLRGNPVDKEKVNWRVRSYSNGFIFARNDIQVPQCVTDEALAAFGAVKGLRFGAFDVVYNKNQNKAYVLECNTAPGLEGTTLDNYVKAFKEMAA